MPSPPPPEVLVERARNGDRRAFAELLRLHDDAMRGLAWRYLADRAAMDDALQDAYVKAYRALPHFRGEARFGTWLHQIVRTTCLDHIRRRDRRREVSLELVRSTPATPDATDPAANRHAIADALAALPDAQRAVVVLVDWEGFGYDDAAALLEISPGTVASRLSRARSTLRAALGADFGEDAR